MNLLVQVGLANVGKSTLFQAITKCSLGNPAVRSLGVCGPCDFKANPTGCRISPMPPLNQKKPASSFLTQDMTGYVNSISPNQGYLRT